MRGVGIYKGSTSRIMLSGAIFLIASKFNVAEALAHFVFKILCIYFIGMSTCEVVSYLREMLQVTMALIMSD